MNQEKIQRINALAHKSKTAEGLTEPEKAEQTVLRREYIQSVRGSLEGHLEHTYLVDEQGQKSKLRKRDKANEQG